MQPADVSQEATAHRINRPVPLRERVREAMQELIISRQLAPGQHLVESELAETLGVSRQPVREALQLLNSEGWVQLHPGYGAFVHSPADSEVDQLLTVRTALEAESARLAAHQVTAEDVARLRTLCADGEAALQRGDTDAMVNANAQLHRAVTEMCGNQLLLDFVSQVDQRVRWYFTPVAQVRGQQSWEEHARLIDAIEAGDADTAARVMREHTERTRQTHLAERTDNGGASEPLTPQRTRRRKTTSAPS